MAFIGSLCFLAIFSNTPACRELTLKTSSTTTTTTIPTTTVRTRNATNDTNPLAPQRLESIKNSYSELNLLSKTKPSDFIFDFDKAVTGVSHGTGGRTVAATVSLQATRFSHSFIISVLCLGRKFSWFDQSWCSDDNRLS
jgi:hypothetical protein